MSKWAKRLLGLATIGSIVAGVVFYFKKSNSDEDWDLDDDEEDEDFDLDEDLKPAAEREYVSLTPSAAETKETAVETEEAETEEAQNEETETEEAEIEEAQNETETVEE